MRRTLYSEVVSRSTLAVATRVNGTANGTTVDRADASPAPVDMFQSIMFAIITGTITDGSHAFAVEASDDGTTWAAVPAAELRGSVPTAEAVDDNKVYDVGYDGPKRFVRVNCTTSGATSGGTFGALVLLGYPRRPPATH